MVWKFRSFKRVRAVSKSSGGLKVPVASKPFGWFGSSGRFETVRVVWKFRLFQNNSGGLKKGSGGLGNGSGGLKKSSGGLGNGSGGLKISSGGLGNGSGGCKLF